MRLKIKAGSLKFFLQVMGSSSIYLNHPFYLGRSHVYMKADREFCRRDGSAVEYKGVFFDIPLDVVDDDLHDTMRLEDIGSFSNILEDCEDNAEITFMYTECPDGAFVEIYVEDEVQHRSPVDLSTGGYPDMSGYMNTCPELDIQKFGTDEIVKAHIHKGLCVVFEMKKPGDVEEFKEFIYSISQKKKFEYEGDNFMGRAARELVKNVDQKNLVDEIQVGEASDDVDASEPEIKDHPAEYIPKQEEKNIPRIVAKKVNRRTAEEIEQDRLLEYASYLEKRGFQVRRMEERDHGVSPSEQVSILLDQMDGITALVRDRMTVLTASLNRLEDPAFVLDKLAEWLGQEAR